MPKPKAQLSTMRSFPLVCDMRLNSDESVQKFWKACIERMLISISPRHVLVLASRPLALALRRSCRRRRWQFRLRFAMASIGTIASGCQLHTSYATPAATRCLFVARTTSGPDCLQERPWPGSWMPGHDERISDAWAETIRAEILQAHGSIRSL